MSDKAERAVLLNQAKAVLREHCSTIIIVAEFIADEPDQIGPITSTCYGAPKDLLGCLEYEKARQLFFINREFKEQFPEED